MSKSIFVTALAAVLLTAPLPVLAQGNAQPSTQAATTTKQTKPKKPLTAAQVAVQNRQKKCGAEWKEAKTAGKVEKGMTWPRYWSLCNKRLKAAGG